MSDVYVLDCHWGHNASSHLRTCFRPTTVADLVAALLNEMPEAAVSKKVWVDVGGDVLCVWMGGHTPQRCGALAGELWETFMGDARRVAVVPLEDE